MSTTYDGTPGADPIGQPPVLAPGHTPASVTERISEVVNTKLTKTPKWWLLGLAVGFGLLNLFLLAVTNLFMTGIGIWGNNVPVGWGWDIVYFVWWIGIGHAGTLISAILLLLHQNWRNSINRFAEAMTLFAVACAGMYPMLHLGRPWLPYWLLPVPGTLNMWPSSEAPSSGTSSPSRPTPPSRSSSGTSACCRTSPRIRDHAKAKVAQFAYGMVALGWRNSSRHWANYETASLLLAGLSTPLVVSVHSSVSLRLRRGHRPGVAHHHLPALLRRGRRLRGVRHGAHARPALATQVVPAEGPHHRAKHIDNMAKVMLVTGLVVLYGYCMEIFFAWYSANPFEKYMMFENRMTGYYAPAYWALIFCNGLMPQFLWFQRVR